MAAFVALVAGCVATAPNVRVGMTKTELRAEFGPPVSTALAKNGGEAWYYDVTFPVVTKSVHPYVCDDPLSGRTSGLDYLTEYSDETHLTPIFISALGRVEDVPAGHVNSTR